VRQSKPRSEAPRERRIPDFHFAAALWCLDELRVLQDAARKYSTVRGVVPEHPVIHRTARMRRIQMKGEGMPFSGFRNPNPKSIAPFPPDDVPEWGNYAEYKNTASSCMLFTFYLTPTLSLLTSTTPSSPASTSITPSLYRFLHQLDKQFVFVLSLSSIIVSCIVEASSCQDEVLSHSCRRAICPCHCCSSTEEAIQAYHH
jgi:hypothetical protein